MPATATTTAVTTETGLFTREFDIPTLTETEEEEKTEEQAAQEEPVEYYRVQA